MTSVTIGIILTDNLDRLIPRLPCYITALYSLNLLSLPKGAEAKKKKKETSRTIQGVTSRFKSYLRIDVFQTSEYLFSILVDNVTCYSVPTQLYRLFTSFNLRSTGRMSIKKIK